MKLLRHICLFCALILSSSLMAQNQRELQQLMRDRGEYYFTLSVDDPAQIQELSRICSVDGTDGRHVVAYANQQEYDKLIAMGYQPELQTPPSLRQEVKMWEGGDRATYEWNSYLTYGDYVAMMEGFPTSVTNGANCSLVDLGTLSTTNHRRILGVRLNNGQPDGKPKFLYTSTMHGDEVTGMILMLRLIDEFCTSTDTRIQNILNNVDLFIFPCTNPDGTYYGGNGSVSGARRANGNNVDLNRHFPDFDDGAHPDGASYYQDECQWMMDLAQEYLFTMGANYHGGAEVVNYPWDTYQPVHPDDAWWQYVSREYAQLCQAVNSSYMTTANSNGDTPSGITNGYAWYTITGSRQDCMNYYGQCREVTIECSKSKTPSASQLPNFWNYNHNAMLTYIEQSLNGVHGLVYDADTGEPIEGVTVSVLNHDALGSSVSTHSIGDFHRPIKGGTYTFEFSKDGYCTEKMNVTVADGQRVDLDVYLTPEGNCPVLMNCYEQLMPSTAGSYVLGYLYDSTLHMPTHNNSSSVTTTSVDVTQTENGFTVGEGSTIPQVTLTAYGSNGQYYIRYNNRYLARASYSNTLTWNTTTSQYGRWYINSNGIYITRNNTNYYLYYGNGSFQISTSQNNNLTFYTEGDCPPEQAVSLGIDWNWWTPTLEMSLEDLEAALAGNAILINSQDGGFARYDGESWSGTLMDVVPGKMYKILTEDAIEFTLSGEAVTSTITILPGYNWFGYTGSRPTAIAQSLGSGFTPTEGDQIIAQNGQSVTYENGSWTGTLVVLRPGHGYVYHSNAPQGRSISFK